MTRGWRYLVPCVRPQARGLAVVGVLTLFGVSADLLKPWPMKVLIDDVLAGQAQADGSHWLTILLGADTPGTLLVWLVVATILLFLVSEAASIVRQYVQTGIGARMALDLGAELFDHLQRLSLRFHVQHRSGDLVRRVTVDSGCIRDIVVSVALPVIVSILSLVAMLVVMWQIDPWLSSLAILAALPLGVLVKLCLEPMAERSYRQQELEGEMMALAEQTLTAIPVVQAYGQEKHGDERFHLLSVRTVRAYLHEAVAQLQFKVGTGAITAIGTAAMMALGGVQVLQGTLSLGSLLVFLSYLGSLYGPLETLAYVSTGYASAAAKARRVFEVLDAEADVCDLAGARALPGRTRGHLRLERVTFGYDPGRPVLQAVSLEARPGEMLALVGPTGAGKSTLASLIPRLFDPDEGRVVVDGHDLRELRLADVRAQVALVLQEPFLLPISVAENIAYGRPDATRAEIEAAARAANAEEFIVRLTAGYETILGERGATLSGGQRQRIAIARALLKDAPILILDEPTAALDVRTESLVMEALERLIAGRTTVVIAHRLSTIRRADRIAVLDKGRVVESGSEAELLAAGGLYARLHALQTASPRTVVA
jgi:ATP-binding cassette, subfamily B, bacterial